jgi:hypothetical protein
MTKIISSKGPDLMYDKISDNGEMYGEELMDGLPGDLSYTFDEKVRW